MFYKSQIYTQEVNIFSWSISTQILWKFSQKLLADLLPPSHCFFSKKSIYLVKRKEVKLWDGAFVYISLYNRELRVTIGNQSEDRKFNFITNL